jgi:hypothetical protein
VSASSAACQLTYTPTVAGTVAISAAYGGDNAHTSSLTAVPLTALPAPQSLAVSKAGSGSGSVTSIPAGINCGATCSASFAAGAVVTLTEAASSGSVFAGWSGAGCAGASTRTLTWNADQAVRVTFAARPPNTTIRKATINQRQRTATFTFTATEGSRIGAGFQCALVKRRHAKPKFGSCRTPKRFARLAPGTYTFQVRAFDSAGEDSSPATRMFMIGRATPS